MQFEVKMIRKFEQQSGEHVQIDTDPPRERKSV
jgi:hypothetical protein